jgi:hypothetical protein
MARQRRCRRPAWNSSLLSSRALESGRVSNQVEAGRPRTGEEPCLGALAITRGCHITLKVVSDDPSCFMLGWGARAACAEVSTGSVEASRAKHGQPRLQVP